MVHLITFAVPQEVQRAQGVVTSLAANKAKAAVAKRAGGLLAKSREGPQTLSDAHIMELEETLRDAVRHGRAVHEKSEGRLVRLFRCGAAG